MTVQHICPFFSLRCGYHWTLNKTYITWTHESIYLNKKLNPKYCLYIHVNLNSQIKKNKKEDTSVLMGEIILINNDDVDDNNSSSKKNDNSICINTRIQIP